MLYLYTDIMWSQFLSAMVSIKSTYDVIHVPDVIHFEWYIGDSLLGHNLIFKQ